MRAAVRSGSVAMLVGIAVACASPPAPSHSAPPHVPSTGPRAIRRLRSRHGPARSAEKCRPGPLRLIRQPGARLQSVPCAECTSAAACSGLAPYSPPTESITADVG
jgi:hypothetical protein